MAMVLLGLLRQAALCDLQAMEFSTAKEQVSRWQYRRDLQDYSWEGLRSIEIKEAAHKNGATNLQDYWITDPVTGRPRSLQTLIDMEEVEEGGDGKLWHIVHLPAEFELDGQSIETWKADSSHQRWRKFREVVTARLNGSSAPERGARGQIVSRETRAILSGMVSNTFECPGAVLAHSAQFLEDALIPGNGLTAGADFSECLFRKSVIIKGNHPSALFGKAVFLGDLLADSTSLERSDFAECKFFGRTSFFGARFSGEAKFSDCEFVLDASFVDSEFQTSADFRRSTFRRYGLFEGCALHADVTFDAVEFTEVRNCLAEAQVLFWMLALLTTIAAAIWWGSPNVWTSMALLFLLIACASQSRWGGCLSHAGMKNYQNWEWWADKKFQYSDARFERHTRALRTLILLCEGAKNTRDAARFHKLEMQATRLRPSTSRIERVFSASYDLLSGYGNSLGRPLVGLVVTVCTFAVIFFAMEGGSAKFQRLVPLDRAVLDFEQLASPDLAAAVDFSLSRVTPFYLRTDADTGCLDFAARLEARSGCAPSWMGESDRSRLPLHRLSVSLAKLVETALALIFVFLIALAARRKFQVS